MKRITLKAVNPTLFLFFRNKPTFRRKNTINVNTSILISFVSKTASNIDFLLEKV